MTSFLILPTQVDTPGLQSILPKENTHLDTALFMQTETVHTMKGGSSIAWAAQGSGQVSVPERNS